MIATVSDFKRRFSGGRSSSSFARILVILGHGMMKTYFQQLGIYLLQNEIEKSKVVVRVSVEWCNNL